MDEFDFGASIWASAVEPENEKLDTDVKAGPSSPFTVQSSPSHPDTGGSSFDDDDFNFSAPITAPVDTGDDDFGDFGEFGDALQEAGSAAYVESTSFQDDGGFFTSQSTDWEALHLNPVPSHAELRNEIEEILQPLWKSVDPSGQLTDENIREVGGLNQVLVTPESRALYNSLYNTSPLNIQPPNWTRSRIRRRHLVSLGIPVNLDEVLPIVNGKPMPALQITTRPSSAPPGPRNLNRVTSPPPVSAHPSSRPGSRPGTPKPSASGRTASVVQPGFGPKPEIDEDRIKQVLAMTPDSLALLPLPTLQAQLSNMRLQTEKTSELLAYLLEQRDALQQDSEMYNGLIAELVGEAQKMKSGSKQPKRTGSLRRSSGFS